MHPTVRIHNPQSRTRQRAGWILISTLFAMVCVWGGGGVMYPQTHAHSTSPATRLAATLKMKTDGLPPQFRTGSRDLKQATLPKGPVSTAKTTRGLFTPSTIPPGTSLEKLTIIGNGFQRDASAFADTDGDGILNSSAFEEFISGERVFSGLITRAITISPKTGRFYVAAADDENKVGVIGIFEMTSDYKARLLRSFDTDQSTAYGMEVVNTAAGDSLIVASTTYTESLLNTDRSDAFSLIVYPPAAGGFPDGNDGKVIIAPKTRLANDSRFVVAFSTGAMTQDGKGNLIINLGLKDSTQFNGGFFAVIRDTDNDGVPDSFNASQPEFFESFDGFVAGNFSNSIVSVPGPGSGRTYYVYSPIAFGSGNTAQSGIVALVDADGDLRADAAPTGLFLASPTNSDLGDGIIFGGAIQIFGRMVFASDNLFYSYFTQEGSDITGMNLNATKIAGGTVGTTVTPLNYSLDGDEADLITFVGVAATGDSVPPTIQVTSPNGGETLQSGTELAISWTSSDDKGVVAHDIALSNDGGGAFPFVVATGLAGSAQSFSYPIPGALETPNARIQVTAKDAGGNVASDNSDADFVIQIGTGADTEPPSVTVTAPTAGATLNGGRSATVSFTSTDNVGVISHTIAFASDGTTFGTTLVTGLPGSASSFDFTVPNQATTTGVIRVRAFDGAGNNGDGLSGAFTIASDTVKPTVTVTSPGASTKKVKRGDPINVAWTSTDNGTIAKHDVLLSTDDGATFGTSLATGLAGTAQSFTATAPSSKVKKAIIKVIATDAAGNAGEGLSTKFKVK